MHDIDFHPAVRDWFRRTFAAPTPCQRRAWPAIQAGGQVLIAAPTGSGKTLAAFLAAIDDLVRQGLEAPLADATQVVYVSPLKALSNDIHKNLEAPLAGIQAELAARGLPEVAIRTLVRTGDTPQASRAAMRRRPPHILVTTPESLYILLTSEGGRGMLAGTRTVIIDEIHAVAGSKRGSHLALSLERLEALAGPGLKRIGLSATQKPVEAVARFLVGAARVDAEGRADCTIIDAGHIRDRDLAVELPRSPLEAVMAAEVWEEIYDRLTELIDAHRTTLVFVNTRRQAERVARHLSDRIGPERVTAHHGSLSREQRLDAEQRLKAGALGALVATSSLELGIDIGEVELVCQLGTTRSIAAWLQRAGRAGHSVGGLPKGRLFPLSRDELVEACALMAAVERGELDALVIPERPLDVLAQQVVACVACEEWEEGALYERLRRAWPYRDLDRASFDAVVRMLAEGYSTRRGRRSAYLHRDAVHRRLRARRGARLTAITCGGAIPDTAAYEVRQEPGDSFVGTVDEDFAVESLAGDIFQLGNTAWRILRVESGTVRVEDAQGQPPNIPFWFGEAPARSPELSAAVSRVRAEVEQRLEAGAGRAAVADWLAARGWLPAAGAGQMVDYLAAARAALGALPTRQTLVMERFFDESGGMQLVIHAPFGSRLNRAWGLALRKRFCRQFNFELQAAATEDAIVLSLGETHSFPLEEVWRFLHSASVRELLTQALLDAPMFNVRWRWNATTALAIRRFQGGRKTPPRLLRMQAEDLVAAVFPDQIACLENVVGRREIPDHPLVAQSIGDCLTEAMDIDALEALLRDMEGGGKRLVARDLTEPSPLAAEILSARPYAFLDDAPLEERRTQAVQSRRWLDPETAADLGRLDPEAIERVRREAWPDPETADELHDALILLAFLGEEEGRRGPLAEPGSTEAATVEWSPLFAELRAQGRAVLLEAGGTRLWAAVERLPQLRTLHPGARAEPEALVPAEFLARVWTREEALVEVVRSRLEGSGPVTIEALAGSLGTGPQHVEAALVALEAEGFVLRGHFTPGSGHTEWCERRLLARIHRYTLKRLREAIQPVSTADFMRFLLDWHGLTPGGEREGPQAVAAVLGQLEGFEAAAAAWEGDILPSRVEDYDPQWLDSLCLAGRVQWRRLSPPRGGGGQRSVGPLRSTPVTLLGRGAAAAWIGAAGIPVPEPADLALDAPARRVLDWLESHGASFFEDIVSGTALLRTQVEAALGVLAAWGLVSSDSFNGLRALLVPADKRRPLAGQRRRRGLALAGIEDAGRWQRLAGAAAAEALRTEERVLPVAWALLRRYGVVCRRILEREGAAPPWRDLLRCYRRLEARGEIRGGRFVAGVSGEQYALIEAVGSLRETRKRPPAGELVSVSAADPLNLVGILTPGPRVPALAGNRILYRDGVPIAVQQGRDVQILARGQDVDEWQTRNALIRRRSPPQLRAYLGHRR